MTAKICVISATASGRLTRTKPVFAATAGFKKPVKSAEGLDSAEMREILAGRVS